MLDLLAGAVCPVPHQGLPVPQEGSLPLQHEPRAAAITAECWAQGSHGALSHAVDIYWDLLRGFVEERPQSLQKLSALSLNLSPK